MKAERIKRIYEALETDCRETNPRERLAVLMDWALRLRAHPCNVATPKFIEFCKGVGITEVFTEIHSRRGCAASVSLALRAKTETAEDWRGLAGSIAAAVRAYTENTELNTFAERCTVQALKTGARVEDCANISRLFAAVCNEVEALSAARQNDTVSAAAGSERPQAGVIPAEIDCKEIRGYLAKARQLGFVDDYNRWTGRKVDAAIFARECSRRIAGEYERVTWKPYETLLNVGDLRQNYRKYEATRSNPERVGKIMRIWI